MANIKSAKKRARQSEMSRQRNVGRRSAIKTAVRKVTDALSNGLEKTKVEPLLKEVAAQLSRAKSKGVIHANTASRKLSRLAKKVATTFRTEKSVK